MRCLIFSLALIISHSMAFSQTSIRLMEQSYICKACEYEKPHKITIDSMKAAVQDEHSLQTAFNKIFFHFKHAGDRFILFCKECTGKRTMTYLAENIKGETPDRKGLGVSLITTRYGSGNNKGVEQFYSQSDLYSFLSDSVLVFDSIVIPLNKIADRGNLSLSSTQLSFNYSGTPILRSLPYDREKDALIIKYKSVFGNSLNRDVTDAIPVRIIYHDVDGNIVSENDQFRVFFATPEEKQTIKELYFTYKTAFPDWNTEEIAHELAPVLTNRYKNISTTNFVAWLKTLTKP